MVRSGPFFVVRSVVLVLPMLALWFLDINWDQQRYIKSTPFQITSQFRTAIAEPLASFPRENTRPQVDPTTLPPECQGKERLVEILWNAGRLEISKEECEILPTWEEVSSLYGNEPIIHGLETCAAYRASLSAEANGGVELEPDPRIAGLFNTGTNAFSDSLQLNFHPVAEHNAYNLVGGKHTRFNNRRWARGERNNTNFHFLPIVLIRDPFRWMASMCKAPYVTRWQKGLYQRCPNLVPSKLERRQYSAFRAMSTFEVHIERQYDEQYNSLADMWSEWYLEYYRAAIPRLIIRYEDTLFHADKVMTMISDCVGKPMQKPFQYHLEASKIHGKPADFTTALAKYGTEKDRYIGLLPKDRKYVQTALDPTLMTTFHYPNAPLDLGSDYREDEEQLSGLEIRHESCKGKKKMLGLLFRAGMKDLDADLCDRLPAWNDIRSTYGDEPTVIGLDTCPSYRQSLNGSMAVPRIGGFFHSGTEHLSKLLQANLPSLEDQRSLDLQGGTLAPLEIRKWFSNPSATDANLPFFPIIVVKDPFYFMIEMCKAPLNARWGRGWYGRCPNLVPSQLERKLSDQTFHNITTFQVTVEWKNLTDQYDSLADMWSSWYKQILYAPIPRLVLRYEDVMLHPEKAIQLVSDCLGIPMQQESMIEIDVGNGPGTSLLEALTQYKVPRYTGLTSEDRQYVLTALDAGEVGQLHYPVAPTKNIVDSTNEQFAGFETTFQRCKGKKQLLGILHRAGKENITQEDCGNLPSWSSVTGLYGEGPIVVGLERCDEYRASLSKQIGGNRSYEPSPRIGGLFNTGTTAFSYALHLNLLDGNFSHRALPGGKHTLPSKRRWYSDGARGNKIDFLPIFLIRDPFRWMSSMCHLSYKASWQRGHAGRCPNLVPSTLERTMSEFENVTSFHVTVKQIHEEQYDSLAHMWSEWYRSIVAAEFPRLIIRFEDTLFHAEKVMDMVAKCIGRPLHQPYKYLLEQSKPGTTAFPEILAKYGTDRGRYDQLSQEDSVYLRSALTPALMAMFHYPPMPFNDIREEFVDSSRS